MLHVDMWERETQIKKTEITLTKLPAIQSFMQRNNHSWHTSYPLVTQLRFINCNNTVTLNCVPIIDHFSLRYKQGCVSVTSNFLLDGELRIAWMICGTAAMGELFVHAWEYTSANTSFLESWYITHSDYSLCCLSCLCPLGC